MKQTMTRLLSWDASHKLGTITASTLVVAGAADTAIPLQGQNLLVSKIPDAGLVTLNGGHWAFLQEWGTTKAVLESYLKGDE
jgi:pimeloyl-ACP methyl ester carboxylesterase